MIKPIPSNIIDVPFRVYKTHDPKADYIAYKELLVERTQTKQIYNEKIDETRAIDRAEKMSLDRQPQVIFDATDIPLLSAAQSVLPVARTQIQNYVRANKIPVGHFIDFDV
jgi:hypothetical protein